MAWSKCSRATRSYSKSAAAPTKSKCCESRAKSWPDSRDAWASWAHAANLPACRLGDGVRRDHDPARDTTEAPGAPTAACDGPHARNFFVGEGPISPHANIAP